ncbi:hypothetical protein ABEL47_01720 [Escherichia coli]
MPIVSTKTFTNFADKPKGQKASVFGAYCEASKDIVEMSYRKPKHVIAEGRKRRAHAKQINILRQEAVHERGFKLDLIFPLSIEELKWLLSGVRRFNEYEELVAA